MLTAAGTAPAETIDSISTAGNDTTATTAGPLLKSPDSSSVNAQAIPDLHSQNILQIKSDSIQTGIKKRIQTGTIFGKFTKEDSPVLLEGSITVPSGKTLEFDSGCVVYLGGTYSTITVFGQIIARGSKDEPVIFMSAKLHPNPWDWDRIYCRSRNRSVFEHCIVRHSNYGISVENGSVDIANCIFEHNSLYGVAVKNSDVSISGTIFRGGHVMGIMASAGASITGQDITVTDNTTGIGCDGNATIKLTNGAISGNINGLVVAPNASVSIIGTDISHNKTGIVAEHGIPKKNRQMVYANAVDEKIMPAAELQDLLKEPEPVHSVVLPTIRKTVAVSRGFKPGFEATSASNEPVASFIGNVTAGFRYFDPVSYKHPVQDTFFRQTLYPTGMQPEVQVFASGKRGKTDINLLMDIYSNPWLSTEGSLGKNTLNLGMTYDNHSLSFGDFFEGGSETSISGRQMTGIKYTGYYWDMGGGMQRMEYKLAAGESEVPKDSGHHDLNQYNVKVDSGMSMRQQVTYIMATTLRPTRTTTFSAEGVISRDQTDQPLFRNVITDPGAPRPIEAQTGVLAGTVSLFRGAAELFAELDLGTHDTIDTGGMARITWYNPELNDALPKIFRNFGSLADFKDHSAATAGGKGNYKGYAFEAVYTEIGPHYFSAGNPYLEINRRFTRWTVDRQLNDNSSAGANYQFERTLATGTPTDRNSINIKGEYGFGEDKPALTFNYTSLFETSGMSERYVIITPDTSDNDSSAYGAYDHKKLTNTVRIEEKQNLQNIASYSCSYQMLWDNDLSIHANRGNNNLGDRMQHQISGWCSFKARKHLRNKTSFRVTLKHENRDSLRSVAYKVSDQLGLTVIPRKLTVTVVGELSNKNEKDYNIDTMQSLNIGWKKPVLTRFYGGELEAKYSFSPRLALLIKGRYEKSYDEIESSRENYSLKTIGLHLTYLF